ncbi:MAG TPA: adenylate/guanylate cyclase domain-containing protein [Anaerolineales bacterium]|nr:adenylate/guanylate cyclase domain-containing protein [Anaerolineales bacterium]
MNCGSRLAVQDESAGGKSQFKLYRYLPQELITKLESARSRNSMVGERRVITMLFCDVKGSTAAAEKVDPETWTDVMNGVFEVMIPPIYKYEGLVPRLMGDAILAFFGAPITHEDDPQRAVLAGLEIQEGIKPYAEEIRLRYGLEFGLRVGINTGLVVVGEIGSDLRMEYTALGDAINLAARMEQTAQVGTIQISDETYKLVAPFFDVQSLGGIEVKGKSEPIQTYRVLGVKSTPGQLRGLEGLASPLVGREPQFGLLKERLEELRTGKGSTVAVVGEAGLGKSTLIAELKKSTVGSHFNWLKGESLSYTRSITYYPWRQVIRQSVDARDEDSAAEVRHKLGYVCDCCTLPGGDIPFLEAMLAVESEESAKVVMGFQGDALNQRMIDATRGFMCGLAVESPMVIVFDDLHWSDEASLNLLLNVVELSTSQPIVFICMARPETTAASWDVIHKMKEKLNGAFYSLELAPLQVDQTETLLNNLLGFNNLPKTIRDLITEKAEGNPFFVEELIRSLIETKQIVHENGHWKALSDDARISMPNTLRGVLSARIDRLAEMPKHVLQNAAVIGRLFDLRILRRLTGLNGELDPQIQYLQDVSLIQSVLEDYAFRHVLIQEATYESILIKQRAELHRQIGETLEELHANRIEEFAPLIAHHFYSAGDDRSLKYDLIAGEKSARLYANAEAATHFHRALEAAKRIRGDANQIKQIFNQLGQVLELTGRYEQALAVYDDMLAFGSQHRDRSAEMSALMAKATIYSIFSQLHNPDLSAKLLLDALEISRELGDRAAQTKLSWNLMLNNLFSKKFEAALNHGETALRLARELGDREQLAFVLNDLCRLYTCLGRFDDAYVVIQEARSLWIEQNNQVMLADSLGSEAEAAYNAGEFARAFENCRQAMQISDRIKNVWGQSYDRMLMTFTLLQQGQLGKAIPLGEQSTRLADEAGLIASSITLRSELAWTHAFCGAFDQAYRLVAQAIQFAESKQPAWRVFPQAALVRIHLLHGDIESAQRDAGDAPLQPISIPYARFTIFLVLANIELAYTRGEYATALSMIDELLEEVMPLTRLDVPEVLRHKGLALIGLHREEEALLILTKACSLASGMGAGLQLWLSYSNLADVQERLGNNQDAESNRNEARKIIQHIAESLHEIGLTESFLNQPQVQNLMKRF